MATHLFPHHSCFRFSLILVSLLTLMGILVGCGSSSTASSSHPTGSTSAPTPIKELKGTISLFPVPNRLSTVNGITAGPDNALWFTEDTSNHAHDGKIGRITPKGKMSEFPVPNPSAGPGSITVGPDGKLWYTELLSNKIGRLV